MPTISREQSKVSHRVEHAHLAQEVPSSRKLTREKKKITDPVTDRVRVRLSRRPKNADSWIILKANYDIRLKSEKKSFYHARQARVKNAVPLNTRCGLRGGKKGRNGTRIRSRKQKKPKIKRISATAFATPTGIIYMIFICIIFIYRRVYTCSKKTNSTKEQ